MNLMKRYFFFFLLNFLGGLGLCAQDLKQSILHYLADKQAEVGVAVIFNGTDTLLSLIHISEPTRH